MSELASESSARAEIIRLHDLRPAKGAKTAKTRVGRGEGGKGGKTAGRGTKGTKARKNVSPAFEGGQMPLHMRLPKLKGFRNRFRVEYQVVNVGDLGRLFPDGGEIGPAEIAAAGAVRRKKPLKVLGEGSLSVALQVSAHRFSGAPSRRSRPRAAPSTSCSPGQPDGAGRRAGPARHRPLLQSNGPGLPGADTGGSGSAQRIPVGSDHAGPAEEDPLHSRDHRGLPHRGGHPDTGRVVPERPEVHRAGRGRRQRGHLLPDQPVLRRSAAPALGVRAGHHALHHGEHHHPAAHRGHSAVRAAEEGRPVGSEQADPVHALSHDRAGRPAGHGHHRPRRPRPALRRLQRARHPRLERLDPLDHGARHDRGHRRHHVAGRADHRARHRQRHVPADLHGHRGPDPRRGQADPLQRRPGVRGHLRVRPGHHRERGVRRAGPTAHPRPVREAHGGQADVRRHVDVPAAEGQPGGRHPGDLRIVAALPSRSGLPADRHIRAGRSSSSCRPTWWTRPTRCTSRSTSC